MEALQTWFIAHVGTNPLVQGLIGGLVIAGFNTLGALTVLLFPKVPQKFLDASLGFAAGVMITASFTSLMLPGIELGGIGPVLIGAVLGAVMLDLTDHFIPHMHFIMGEEGPQQTRIRAVWLLIIAITLHNMPEGLAVGVGFGSGNLKEAFVLMMAIGFQNIPEGFAVAVSSLSAGFGKRFYASVVGIRSGLVEVPLAVLGAWAVTSMAPILPYAMGFAAGAMLYVVSDEIVPESHRQGHERLATFGTMVGILVMLYLDVTLG
ncbi:MAG: ZIP family metal transporter [Armatimonadetes bacterium CG_4_10_14_3_um_filter_66_18]|nr:ZIP family metal transporter [Armatimonadota bacterium]OIO92370.1 MAG: ZIP family metal transporter [Armatimonadetes bacterium CG2_30_66_41]PIU93371.1 MAG: ZIP family metal transporter [Armatimonadetes bacterium CG06_land_8_20_14_3_00_66_21]PIX40100.1 MAG: ZIP family metal transporter [Armatimonadetes bacterium CG_4_8_14_3_um_filter_66_20]PIY40061.1 MAG: ZIP family metal transporter [Armatimonadetes bacterium CG_4_10_14_3_um_filter_66_18]PIZ37566.1 MAG: ZIP family metal transporter [Armatim